MAFLTAVWVCIPNLQEDLLSLDLRGVPHLSGFLYSSIVGVLWKGYLHPACAGAPESNLEKKKPGFHFLVTSCLCLRQTTLLLTLLPQRYPNHPGH